MAEHAPGTGVGARVLSLWTRCQRWPAGSWLFGVMLGRMVPYSGSIRPRIVELTPGRAVVRLRDRRAVRNHLRSIHAVALANLGELASGLAMTTSLPDGIRAIVTRLTIDFTKKARGTLTAVGTGNPPSRIEGPMDVDVTTIITDESGDEVAVVHVTWRIAPR